MLLHCLVAPNVTGRSGERKGRAQGFELRECVLGWIPRAWDRGLRKITKEQAELAGMGSLSRDSATGLGCYSSCCTTWTIQSSWSNGAWMAGGDGMLFAVFGRCTGEWQWRPLGCGSTACHPQQTTAPLLRSSNTLLLCVSGETCLILVLRFPLWPKAKSKGWVPGNHWCARG